MSFIIASCLLGLSVGAEPLGEAARKEFKSLQGVWIVQHVETKNGKHEPDDGEQLALTIMGTKWSFGTLEQGEIVAIDPSTSPKLIDLNSVREGRNNKFAEAIYHVDGDKLLLSIYQGENKNRPTRLDKPIEANTLLWTLERSKK